MSKLTPCATLLLILAACTPSGSTAVPPPPPPPSAVASVTLSQPADPLAPGGTVQVNVTLKDAAGAVLTGRTITWDATPGTVASVNGTGLVTAVAPGTATITATSEGKSGVAKVTVRAPVASLTLPATATVELGTPAQLPVVVMDAQGNVLTDRPVLWSSSSTATATVSAAGVVSGVAVGTVTITATSETRSGSTMVTVARGPVAAFMQKPFAGEFLVYNPMDHDTPQEFVDHNGRFVTSWGETAAVPTDGHAGYDFLMPVGTPILAAAGGVVTLAQPVTFFCPVPSINANVSQRSIIIRHELPGGNSYQTTYAHISREDVTLGQVVTAGQQIALSGNTGCTTAPHLHFQVDRINGTNGGQMATVDPYGWTGAQADPWEVNSVGAKSVYLWKSGQAPEMFVGQNAITQPLNGVGSSPTPKAVVIAAVRWMGSHDELNPNNEAVDIQIDPAVSSAPSISLTGYYLKNNNGDRFNFPTGFTIAQGQTIRVSIGSGTSTATTLFWGRAAGVFNNLGDCAQLFDPGGGYYLNGWVVACR